MKMKPNLNQDSFIHNIKRYKGPLLMTLPAIIAVFVFGYLPMSGLVIAFKDYNIFDGIWGSPWVGWDNFITVFNDPDMLKAIFNTFLYGVVIVFGAFPFPIILALLFNELRNMRFKKFAQSVAYLPHFLSWITVIGLFYTLFATEGPINQILVSIFPNYEPKNILLDSKYFLPIIFSSHLWKNVGWSSVLFLAAITGIDQTLYEAASVDGCGKWRQVWHVTLPGIKSTAVIALVMSLSSLVNVNFEQIYGFQNVYTQDSTEIISTLIYRQGIQNGKYSLSTAFGLAQGVVMASLVLGANAISKKVADTSIW